ncbi:alanine racemase [Curtobacterium sp. MCPF17_002]|uniref:alanine racemase n=1 Tax=Curtobacterium sp. MCPF17_002 TaxID=2175645 RepID=UPI000DA9AE92|nr:alanine racemase [Curtobacterium sp. MCPF17_002]WIB75935.1 alanine racemase [Curtobacterium sp. MCPF17_002]
MTTSAPQLVVHDDAIRANTSRFADRTDGRLMAVLKADGFGHGAIARSVIDAGATSIGVTTIDEALAIRRDGADVPVLSWLNPVDADFEAALLADVDIAVSGVELLSAVSRAALRTRRRARVHLHVDVGMSRDGAAPETWSALCTAARELQLLGTVRVVGVMGHMSCADRPEDPQNDRERLLFANAVRTARRRGLAGFVTHLAATAATITGAGGTHDVHRIGAGLFGIDPSATSTDLRPTLSLTAPVVGTREIGAGVGIGYGLDHVAAGRTNLALLPLGYGDGLPRSASERAEVHVRGRRRPLVGRFSMDMVVVDTGDDRLHLGETVTLFGRGTDGDPTVADWARWADTIEHEIVTRIGSRVARVHRSTDTLEAAHA